MLRIRILAIIPSLLLVTLHILTTTSAIAHPAIYTSEATFLDIVSGLELESFESQATTSQNTAPIVTSAFTATIETSSPGTLNWRIIDFNRPDAGTYATDGNKFVEAGSQSGNVPFIITFTFNDPITAFGLNIVDFGDLASEGELILRNEFGQSFTIATAPGLDDGNLLFFGLENSSQPFSTVYLEKTTTTDGIALDEIYFQPASESPLTLLTERVETLEGIVETLIEQIADLQENASNHAHTYLTGGGRGHNEVETLTGVAEFD